MERNLGLRHAVTCRRVGNSPFMRHISVYEPNQNWHPSKVASPQYFSSSRYVSLNVVNELGALPKGVTRFGYTRLNSSVL